MNILEETINKLGKKFKGKVSTPIIVGGWAVNLLGMARQTLDFDFMIREEDFNLVKAIFSDLSYRLTAKTSLFARFESENKDSYPVYDCLFADNSTYRKLYDAGKAMDIFGAEFILPDPLHVIAMKLHALKYGSKDRKNKDLGDIQALIDIYKISINPNSDFEELCLRFGTPGILKELRNEK